MYMSCRREVQRQGWGVRGRLWTLSHCHVSGLEGGLGGNLGICHERAQYDTEELL